MKSKRLFKGLALLFSSSLVLGTFLSARLAHKEDNINTVLAYEGTPLPTSGTLSAGTYYLSSDLTVSSILNITSGDVIVNLNGHTLNGGGRDKGIFYVTGGTLTVNGKDDATDNRGVLNNGGGYYPGSGYSKGGALYLSSGKVTINDCDITNCQSNFGGAIYIQNDTVTLNNCNLSSNIDTNSYGTYGAIYVESSSSSETGLTINGGEMSSNYAAIYLNSNGKATINGVSIHDNDYWGVYVANSNASLKISGDTIIKDNNASSGNLRLNGNNQAKVVVASELGDNAYIGVTMTGDAKGVFTNSTDTSLNDACKFVSDDSNYAIGKNAAGQLFLGAVRTVTYSTLHGTAPDPVTVASGSVIPNEPTEPTAEGYVFVGWYKEDTFENAWDFASDTVTSDITLYAKWLAHTHSFTYSSLDNTITATCANTDGNCPFPECKTTLTISAPSGSLIYDGDPKPATYADSSSGVAFSNITISYTKGGTPIVGEPTDYGTYVATVSFDESNLTASVEYSIGKANASVEIAPTANLLTYKGFAQELVNAGTASGGTMVYSLDGINYSESIPTATDVGKYTVYYKVIGDANHNDSAVETVLVTIEKATASITKGTTVTYYDSFDEAVDDWDSGTLTLLKDVTLGTTIDINSSVSLDLNGHGIKFTSTNADIFQINDGGTLSLADSNSTAVHKFIPPSGNYGLATLDEENGILAISGGYITGFKSSTHHQAAFYVYDGGELIINGGNIIGNEGTGTSNANDPFTIGGQGHLIMNGGSIIYNKSTYWGAAINITDLTINGGTVAHNYSNKSIGGINCANLEMTGGSIVDNYAAQSGYVGGITATDSAVMSGNPIIRDNFDPSGESNFRLGHPQLSKDVYLSISDSLGNDAYIGMQKKTTGNTTVFTNSTNVSFNDTSKFHSDSASYLVGKNAAGQLILNAPVTVTYNENGHGIAPDSATVASGSIILSEPTAPTADGYEFEGWYKDEDCTVAWDFATDTVTSATTLYAKWDYDAATKNVINLIDDIGNLTYDGGVNDSLDDIIAAKAAYDVLTPGQKEIINNINKEVLDHDILLYTHVDRVGDLIKAIPAASDSQEYYDAIDAAKAAYDALTDEEKAILNTDVNFDYAKKLNDNLAAEEVIKLIGKIDDITYNGGKDDSKKDIENAQNAYDNLTPEQKEIVNNANKNDLVDAEKVYDTMEAIESIGDVNYDTDSKDKIDAAKEMYDSLSDEQKEKLGEDYANALIKAEKKYNSLAFKSNILVIILLIVASLTLIGGVWFLIVLLKKKRKDDDQNNQNGGLNKKQPAKAYSICGLLPLAILTSNYLAPIWIALYIVAGLAVLVWVSVLVVGLTRKKQKQATIQVSGEPQSEVEPAQESINEDEEETVTFTDENGNIFNIRFIKSFTAKLIQSPEVTKKYYEELKNEVLSYVETNSKVSWHYDSITSGKNQVLKFAIRGKTLCVYYPLNANDYVGSKYKVETIKSKKYGDVPCLYRIKNDRRLGYAKELIATVCEGLGLVKGELRHEFYSNLPYEDNKPLIARGLIKEVNSRVQDQKVVEKYESITVQKADEAMSDEKAEASIVEEVSQHKKEGKKDIINIDTLSENYKNGDTVTLDSLIEKGLLSPRVGYVKVLARGVLDKKLSVCLNDYSLQAVKMIVLLGGQVKKVN